MDSTDDRPLWERWIDRERQITEWRDAAVPITDEEYYAIPMVSHSTVPYGFLGEVKIDPDKRLIAFKSPIGAYHRSPSYSGPL